MVPGVIKQAVNHILCGPGGSGNTLPPFFSFLRLAVIFHYDFNLLVKAIYQPSIGHEAPGWGLVVSAPVK
jgi:hypothetical protein